MIDLLAMPATVRPRNVGGRDGSGLCVFTSIQYAAWWQNEPLLRDFQKKMRQEPGGGWPAKVDAMIAKHGKGARYIQYQGRDPKLIELALRTGRVPCVTWNGNHMLCCVHLDKDRAAVLDNNSPDRLHWLSRTEFLRRWTAGGGGWVVVILNPAPPPPPRNAEPVASEDALEAGPIMSTWAPPEHDVPGGVVWEAPAQESWSVSGSPCDDAGPIIADLEDDARRCHLTIVGDPAPFGGALEALRRSCRVQVYQPDAWELAVGFVRGRTTTVYHQTPAGVVLHRQDDGDGGGEALLRAVQEHAAALRRADPAYRPERDIDRRKVRLPWPLTPGGSRPLVLMGLAGVIVWFLTRR